MNTKTYILAVLALMFALPRLLGQNDASGIRRDQIESFKIAFYTRQLELSSEEAQKFWPVFNGYSADLEAVRTEIQTLQQKVQAAYPTSTDSEIEALSDQFIALKRKEFMVTEAYHEKFKAVLPMRKVILLYRVENDFKKELLKEIRRRRMENRRRH